MSEEKIEQMLNKLIAFIEQVEEFATGQAPLLVHEILLQGKILNSIWMIIPLTITILLVWCIYKTVEHCKKDPEDDEDCQGPFILGCFALAAIDAYVTYLFIVGFIIVWFAPRLYVLDYLQGMF